MATLTWSFGPKRLPRCVCVERGRGEQSHAPIRLQAVRNFVQLCLEGYYDGTPFHRLLHRAFIQVCCSSSLLCLLYLLWQVP